MQIAIEGERFDELLNAQAAALTEHSIGFVLTHVENNQESGVLGGSGTLVSIDGVDGILTAEHVVAALRNRDMAGLVLTGQPRSVVHRMVFEPSYCREFSFGASGAQIDGPDIAFLVLPPHITAELKARRTFYNLTKRSDELLAQPPPREHGFWSLCGLAEEWSADAPPLSPTMSVRVFHGKFLGPLPPREWRASNEWDYVRLEVEYPSTGGVPESFGGYSGGGVWQIIVKPVDGVPTITKAYLMGVAFYQSEKMSRDGKTVRDITCHCRVSVYGALVEKVRVELASRR